MFQH